MNKILQVVTLAVFSTNAFSMSVSEYLDQVRKRNLSYQAADKQETGAELQKREADLFFYTSVLF